MKNLEDIYIQLLGNPKKGDLAELERHYRHIKQDIEESKEGPKVDVSTIQRYGELHNAYLYLKTQWTLKRQQESGLILDNLNLDKNKSKEITKKSNTKEYQTHSSASEFLHSVHASTKNIAKAGCIIVLCAFLMKGAYFLGQQNDVNASSPVLLHRDTPKEQKVSSEVANAQTNTTIQSMPENKAIEKKSIDYANLEDIQQNKKLRDIPIKVQNIEKDISKVDQDNVLFRAAKNCSIDALENALSKHKNINSLDENGQTIAHWLCRMNCTKGVKWAVLNGINIHQRDKSGRTAMDWAKISSSFETIQYLNTVIK